MLIVPTALHGTDPERVTSLCNILHPSDSRLEWYCRRLRMGETLKGLFGDRWKDVARFNRIDRRHVYPGLSLKIPKRLEDVVSFTPMPPHDSSAEHEAKFILVDLSEQFLAAYEYGRLVFSAPITSGEKDNETPDGEFRVTAVDRNHKSSLYRIEDEEIAYPMNYALRFHIARDGVSYWIHGRDLPGYSGSHGCIGLYDEEMQKDYYGYPSDPVLQDAKTLYQWITGPQPDDYKLHFLQAGPRMLIIGHAFQ